MLKCSVAVNKTTGKGDDKRQTTTWFTVTLWRDRAEGLADYVKAGMHILVTGEVHVSLHIDKNSNVAASMKLTVGDMKLLTSKQEMERRAGGEYDEPDADPESQPAKSTTNSKAKAVKGKHQDPEDIPF